MGFEQLETTPGYEFDKLGLNYFSQLLLLMSFSHKLFL